MRDIVFISGYYWGPLKQRYEHLMMRLSKYCKVLFIEMEASIIERVRENRLKDSYRGVRQIDKNLYLLTYPQKVGFYPQKYPHLLF